MQPPIAVKRGSGTEALKYLLIGMRPKQWVKNVFVLLGIVFAEQHLFTQPWALGRVALAFALFCVVSGCVYLMNDLADIEGDRLHPKKRFRPLPAGHLSPTFARIATLVLGLGSLALPWIIGLYLLRPVWERDPSVILWSARYESYALGWFGFGIVLIAYFLLQIAYTFRLKHLVIVDLFCIAGGFVLRALGGAAVLQVIIRPWWLLCVLLLSLFLGLGKRRNELMVLEGDAAGHRRILQEYSPQLLDHLITIVVACTILAYSLATFDAEGVPQRPFPLLMVTIPFVIYALFRYLYLVYQKGEGGTPEELLFKDRPFFFSILSWSVLVMAILLAFGNNAS
jgi:4-hydroxybenzoate polyprenyltransferase